MHLESSLIRENNCITTSTINEWDIADLCLPQTIEINDFQMWPDGHLKLVYGFSKNERVRRHISGWAMRNTNNHNRDILKKSCLGVLLCEENCIVSETRETVTLRPAICDKARKKQIMNKCPNCGGNLVLQPCKGNVGFPVTHYWRRDGDRVFFQAKGHHDHLKPDLRPHRDNRKKNLEHNILYRENNFISSQDSSALLSVNKKESCCSRCLQYNCECQKNLEQLRCQFFMSRRPSGMFWNPYSYSNPINNSQYYYKFPNYLMNSDQNHYLYQQEPFLNNSLSHPPVVSSNSFPFFKSEEISISKPFQIDPFFINSYNSIPDSNIIRESREIHSLYNDSRSSATCRYPANDTLSSNISSTFPITHIKY